MSGPAVRLDRVRRVYGAGTSATTALDGIDLDVSRGCFLAVMGPSGSGKTTLLHCAAGLDRPDGGTVTIDGTDLAGLGEQRLTRFRRARVGFVFQGLNLLPYLTARQNVELPLRLAGTRIERTRVRTLLAAVGMAELADRLPAELSGGQQQRLAVARALIAGPAVVFADEPTGALDSTAAAQVLGLLRTAATDLGQTIVMVTHDPVAAAHADAVVYLLDGQVVGRMARPTADAVAAQLAHLGDLVAARTTEPVGATR